MKERTNESPLARDERLRLALEKIRKARARRRDIELRKALQREGQTEVGE